MRSGLAVILLSAWTLGWPLWGQTKNHPSKQPSPQPMYKQASPRADQRDTKDSPLVVDVIAHPQNKDDGSRSQQEDSGKKFNDRLMAWSAVAAAFFTLLLVIIGYRGVRAAVSTLKVVKLQTQALVEGQRPLIAVDAHGPPLPTIFEPKSPRIELRILNSGVTRAYNFTHETWIELLRSWILRPELTTSLRPTPLYFTRTNR